MVLLSRNDKKFVIKNGGGVKLMTRFFNTSLTNFYLYFSFGDTVISIKTLFAKVYVFYFEECRCRRLFEAK